ncbi:MAG: hypothetical protein KBH06_12200 [Spirochaetes bacterium]|nr:hypothetical protein [Spirochaetota bacterium]
MKSIRIIIAPFAFLSGLGFVLSCFSFFLMIAKIDSTILNYYVYILYAFYVLWMPAIIMSNITARNHVRKDFWKVILWATPKWLKISPITLIIISLLFYLLSFFNVILYSYEKYGYNYFSLFLMAGYLSAFSIFYSPLKEGKLIISKDEYDIMKENARKNRIKIK